MFYVDVTLPGNTQADAVLEGLRKLCPMVKELGRYTASNHASN
jgi:prephenate dehydratase